MRSLLSVLAVAALVWLSVTGVACRDGAPGPVVPTGAVAPTVPVPIAAGPAATIAPTAVPSATARPVPAVTPSTIPVSTPEPTPASARRLSPTPTAVTQMVTEAMVAATAAVAGGPAPQGGGYLPPEAGGSRNPNDAPLPLMYFRGYGVNPFVDADEDPLSTFGLDGDTASFQLMREYLRQGHLLEPDGVRVEEFVNSLPQGYGETEAGLGLHLDAGPSPFGEPGYVLLRVGVSNPAPPAERNPVSVIFVLDVSGSMEADNRLALAKQVVAGIAERMKPGDRAALVTYSDAVRVAYPMSDREQAVGGLAETLTALRPGGSTYAEAGLTEAYRLAAGEVAAGRRVSLMLLSDGVANVGHTGPESILRVVDDYAQRQAALTAVGVGITGNYNDVLLEALANRGNGTYHYLANRDAVGRFLERSAEGVFFPTPRDARIQVEFNPAAVRKYRLLGYENRAVADDDFRDDTLDFGEPGFARDVTALYELRLQEGAVPDDRLAEARLRWRSPLADQHTEVTAALEVGSVSNDLAGTAAHFRQAAAAAEFAELLRTSYWAQCGSLEAVTQMLDTISADLGEDPDYRELRRLVAQAGGSFEPYCQR